MAHPWTFRVRHGFHMTGRGLVIIGHILEGMIHEGDEFVAEQPPIQGIVRGIALVRSDDPEAVALLVDQSLPPGALLSSVEDTDAG